MRALIYVPVIHSSADLGSLAKDVADGGIKHLGEEIWQEHRRTVEGFWDVVSHYFDSIDVRGMKIYQDGMVAEGEVGRKIVQETAGAGSRNYQLVSRILDRGASLVKTEDFPLVKQELDRLIAITQAKSMTRKIMAFIRYKWVKNTLLNKRDAYIAGRIDETLTNPGEGILFIGAFHRVKKWLPKDIDIRELKDTDKMRQYQTLLPFHKKYKKQFDELGKYLVSELT
ncbi:MAG: hypothetical protein A2Z25_03555 [Planctomycetes bacterium RBG_16_55_9]|nr:MAG: hypothetical protein A2Z25_03555 [Planctomycetes bacterium RBG_16_55_9]